MARSDPPTGARSGAEVRVLWKQLRSGAPARRDAAWFVQRAMKWVLWLYLRLVHHYTMSYHPDVPSGRAYIAVMSHTSFMDVPALMVADPYEPGTAMVIKAEMMDVPILGRLLRLWGAIPVGRHGRDVAALRQIRRTLSQGGGICVAPQGTRSLDGRLGPVDPVLARVIVQSDAVVVPVAIVGTRESLPKGAWMVRPHPIYLRTGPPIDLSPFRGRRLTDHDLEAAARCIRDGIEVLLPPEMRALPTTPALGKYSAI